MISGDVVEMDADVMRAKAWRLRCNGGWVTHRSDGIEWTSTPRPDEAFMLDGHDAAVNLALDLTSAFNGVVVEPVA